MPTYSYKAKIKPDVFRSGVIEAENERTAINKLLLMNYHPVSLRLKSESIVSRYRPFKKIKQKNIYIFLRQLSNLTFGGLPIVKSLDNIAAQTEHPAFREVIIDLREKLQKGKTLSEALWDHNNIFSALEINMIKAAEASGKLAEVITRLADLKEKDITFSYKLRSAFTYPIMLIFVGAVTLFVLTSFVLPKFAVLFEDLDQKLPVLTYLLISFSLFCKKYWPLIIFFLLFGLIFLMNNLRTEKGRQRWDELTLRIPGIKTLIVKMQTANFARTLKSLLESGITVVNALQIVSDVMTNKVFALELKQIATLVARGQQLNEAMRSNNIFEKNTMDLIAIGEESGRLEEMLLRLTQMNEQESTQQLDSVVLLIEPFLILILGAIVAFIVVAILLPIFQMNFLIQ